MEIDKYPDWRIEVLRNYAGQYVDDFIEVSEDVAPGTRYYAYLVHHQYNLYLDIVDEFVALQTIKCNKFITIGKILLADPGGYKLMENQISKRLKHYGIGVPPSKWLKINILDG